MPVPTDITAGTLTITNGSTAVTGVGTSWLASDLRQGDIILWIEGGDGFQTPILADVPTSNTALTLVEPWAGPTLAGARYRIRYQWDSSRVSAQSRQLIEMLDNGNVLALSGLTGPGVPVFDGPHSMVIKPEADFINGVAYDVQVDTLTDRAAYDGQAEGFAVLVSDVGDGRSALYSKASNTSGDWTDPAYITGPVGPLPDVDATVANTAPGTLPTVTPVPITGGTRLDFTLPEASGFYNAGIYDLGTAYDQDDVVRHNGSSFIALQAVPVGESPSGAFPPVDTAYWQVLAARGANGAGTVAGVSPGDGISVDNTDPTNPVVSAYRIVGVAANRTALSNMSGPSYVAVDLNEPGRKGLFAWDGSDLSGDMVVRTVTPVTITAATDTFAMRSATTTSVNSTTNVATSAGHGFVADEEVYVTSTVNGLITNGRYFVFFDSDTAGASGGNADNFKLRTSLTASAFDLTGTTNFTIKANHNLLTGNAVYSAATVNGVTADTIYYVIRTDANAFKLATSYANAHAGVAIDLTGPAGMTFKHLADPLQGIYVPPSGGALDGSDGAWVRQKWNRINVRWTGAVGDDSTDNAHALQATVWLGVYFRKPVYTPSGIFQTSLPISHRTNDWIAEYSRREGSDNGIVWEGNDREMSIWKKSSTFLDGRDLFINDGNMNEVASIVGSRPMAQGTNIIRRMGFHGQGSTFGSDSRAAFIRGCWGMVWEDLDFRGFSGDFVTVYSGSAPGAGGDEVDNTSRWTLRRVRMQEGGKSGIRATAVRVTDVRLVGCEIALMNTYGVVGAFVNSTIEKTNFITCGNRADATSCGLRLQDALSASLCRNVTIKECVFENNFNCEISAIQCRGLTLQDNNLNIMLPTGGPVTDKSGIRLVGGALGYIQNVTFIGGRFSPYQAPSDGSIYEVPYIDIKATVSDVLIENPHFVHGTSHVKIASGRRVRIIGNIDYDVILTGTAPVDSFLNGRSLGTITPGEWGYIPKTSFTPVVSGLTSAGVGTYSFQSGSYERQGSTVKFALTVAMTAHTGTGDMVVSLPLTATESSPVSMTYSSLAYTNTPFAEITAENRVRIRQAASDGTVSGVPVDGTATIRISGEYFVA